MRDIALALVLAYFTLRALRAPWIGVITWTVISIMNPHRLSWQLDQYPVAAAVAIATLIGVLASRDRKPFPWVRETVMLVVLMLWFTITTLASGNIEANYELWKKVMKIDFMIMVAAMVLYSRKHIMALAWALVMSIAFFGVKGGIFTLSTGGGMRVWGPPSSYIEGNNEIALALVATIPLLRFLQLCTEGRWIKHGLTVSMVLCSIAALGTQSRGALLAIVAMAVVMWWRSEKKLLPGVVMLLVGVSLLAFMPEEWSARMNTIQEYQDDRSAMGRINAWMMAWNLAKDNFFGGGFQIYNAEMFARYSPNPDYVHAAHSIYFQILGEHGFVGLFLFLLLWLMVWLSAGQLRKQGRAQPETTWVSDLGAMCQVSLVGYAVGGAFLSLAYFDLPYNILVLVVLSRQWMARKAWLTEDPAPGTAGVMQEQGAAPPAPTAARIGGRVQPLP